MSINPATIITIEAMFEPIISPPVPLVKPNPGLVKVPIRSNAPRIAFHILFRF